MTITQKYLKERLIYNPNTGDFIWKPLKGDSAGEKSFNTKYAGKPAGSINKCSNEFIRYLEFKFYGKMYKSHRLAFLYMMGKFPTKQVDHIDGNGLNNKWDNLRQATVSENCANSKTPKNNTSGFKGVSYAKASCKYIAYITKNRQRTHLGYFDTPEKAHAAYCSTAKEYFGEFARG